MDSKYLGFNYSNLHLFKFKWSYLSKVILHKKKHWKEKVWAVIWFIDGKVVLTDFSWSINAQIHRWTLLNSIFTGVVYVLWMGLCLPKSSVIWESTPHLDRANEVLFTCIDVVHRGYMFRQLTVYTCSFGEAGSIRFGAWFSHICHLMALKNY